MEDWFSSGWGEEGNQGECEADQLNKESPFRIPRLPCSADSTKSSAVHFGGVKGEDRAVNASRSHSQAEKRRRDRINSQLATLRKLIPKSDKMDKAALLGSVVEHVKDLKRKATEVGKLITVPTDVDEVTIHCYSDHDHQQGISSMINGGRTTFIRASLCCEDRPEFLAELAQALKALELATVRADIASLGGRIKSILVLICSKEGVCINSTIQSLKGTLSRIASSSTGSSYRMRSKRQRFFLPSQ